MPSHERVRARRLELGLSLKDVAERLTPLWPGTIDESVLSKLERDARSMYADHIPLLAQALLCEPNDLVDWPPEKTPAKKKPTKKSPAQK